MPEPSLFGNDPSLDPALDPTASAESRLAALHRVRCDAYASRLFLNPPIRSCNESEVGTKAAKRSCNRFAKADTDRVAEAERAAGLAIVPLDRLAALEKALGDWLTALDQDAASGGNGCDSIDLHELTSRTQALLDATTLPSQITER